MLILSIWIKGVCWSTCFVGWLKQQVLFLHFFFHHGHSLHISVLTRHDVFITEVCKIGTHLQNCRDVLGSLDHISMIYVAKPLKPLKTWRPLQRHHGKNTENRLTARLFHRRSACTKCSCCHADRTVISPSHDARTFPSHPAIIVQWPRMKNVPSVCSQRRCCCWPVGRMWQPFSALKEHRVQMKLSECQRRRRRAAWRT